jgi:preprotein translocase subunit SecF
MRYVRKQGSYWIKTNENTGWWIEIEGGYYTTISNGSTSQLVPKYLIIEQNYYHQNQQKQKELQELQQQELQEQEFQQQQIQNQLHQKINELENRKEKDKTQVKCQKCGLEGSYVKRKVKSHYYLYIRHKTNGKIKECLISRLA